MALNLNKKYFVIRNIFLLLSGLPFFYLLYRYIFESLGLNPFALLSHTTGHCGFFFLIFTLSITPLRRLLSFVCRTSKIKWGKRLADWNFLIRLRRVVGLVAFFYITLHMLIYMYFELDFDWPEFYYEISTRTFIAVGVVSYLVLLILALTSPTYIKRKMGRWWRRLHRLMYVLSVLAVLHFWLAAKVTNSLPMLYGIIVMLLLAYRIFAAYCKPLIRRDDDGMEVERK